MLHELHAMVLFQPLLNLAQPSSELTPPHASFPPLLTPRLCLAPGIDLSNCGLNCMCSINGSAGCIQDTAIDLSQDGNGQEVGWECRAQAGLRTQGPCPALLESGTLETSWPTPCSSAITLTGGAGRVIREPTRILGELPPWPLFSQMRISDMRLRAAG